MRGTISIPVPLHDALRRGTLLSIVIRISEGAFRKLMRQETVLFVVLQASESGWKRFASEQIIVVPFSVSG